MYGFNNHLFQVKLTLVNIVLFNICSLRPGLGINRDLFLLQVQRLTKNEILMVNIGSLSTGGRVLAMKADLAKIGLTNPVCTEIGEKIALSRRVEKHWR